MDIQNHTGDRFTSRFIVWGKEHSAQRTIVLLHGLFENCTVWDGFTVPFASVLGQKFRVVAIDLLGHNPENPLPIDTYVTLEDMAHEVCSILTTIGIEKALFVGHSMGGAVAMQLLKIAPKRMTGLCLFHATPFADLPDARTSRNATIARIQAGEKSVVVETLLKRVIPEVFWERLPKGDIELLRAIMLQTPENGMIAGHAAMRDREDTQYLLDRTACPILILLGLNDPIISLESMLPVAGLPQRTMLYAMRDVAHAGMIEAPSECLSVLQSFADIVI